MKVTGVILLLTLTLVSGELLQVLHLLHTSDAYHHLTADEKVLLTEVVAAAEACKLHAFAHTVGRDAIVSLIAHLPGQAETVTYGYITDHLKSEADGNCVVDSTPRPTGHS